VTAVAVLLVIAIVGGYLWASSVFNRIEKVPMGDTLATSAGTNYLIVGSDSRAAIADDDPTADAFLSEGAPGGQRSDTMVVLRLDGDGAVMVSIPRDLYVTIADSGRKRKINAAFNDGPQGLVRTVSGSLGIPIHHYLEVDFVSFAGLVDAIGGVTIDFPHPAFDRKSGLDVKTAGPVELDGSAALAYVRSRSYTEVIDGEERRDATADLGRIQRQQAFLRAVLDDLGSTKNPIALAQVASRMSSGLRIDDRMTLLEAMRFAWRLRGLDPEPLELPTDQDRNEAGAVLLLREAEAAPILDRLRGG
jgi:LCP family protein required for cell wall assembly